MCGLWKKCQATGLFFSPNFCSCEHSLIDKITCGLFISCDIVSSWWCNFDFVCSVWKIVWSSCKYLWFHSSACLVLTTVVASTFMGRNTMFWPLLKLAIVWRKKTGKLPVVSHPVVKPFYDHLHSESKVLHFFFIGHLKLKI